MSKNLVLFDLDGTLTKPRQRLDQETGIIDSLIHLIQVADVGIVTGSPISYIGEQCEHFLDTHSDSSKLLYFPCNGTQRYTWCFDDHCFEQVYSHSMRDKLGEEDFRKIMAALCEAQYRFTMICESMDIDVPLTGDFITYRESMINWSLIGRGATLKDREKFTSADKNLMIRDRLMTTLMLLLKDGLDERVAIVLGGETGFDIYPTGWDKSYVLDNLLARDPTRDIFFVGDKCDPGGNDHEIYTRLIDKNRAFKVDGPLKTVKLIDNTLIPALSLSQ